MILISDNPHCRERCWRPQQRRQDLIDGRHHRSVGHLASGRGIGIGDLDGADLLLGYCLGGHVVRRQAARAGQLAQCGLVGSALHLVGHLIRLDGVTVIVDRTGAGPLVRLSPPGGTPAGGHGRPAAGCEQHPVPAVDVVRGADQCPSAGVIRPGSPGGIAARLVV
ncbi:hypothetical protein G6F22_006815 [Rhizopus arrhizus]|nr:hypothetical protein G6F22_006815 [Rhizopus arrhizus]